VIKTIERTLSDRWTDFAKSFEGNETDVDWAGLQVQIESDLRRLARRELQSSPLLVFLLQSPEEPPVKVTGRRRRSTARVAS
jgi:ribonuclease J